jgi:cell division protein FtsA
LNSRDDLIFALDIGTRTLIGLVMEYTGSNYRILASEVVEHEHRAMLDGQIHDVNEVSKQLMKLINSLEEKLNVKLQKVAIAAAGRALKTFTHSYSMEFDTKKLIDEEDVRALEFSAIKEVQENISVKDGEHIPWDYHFVDYSVIEYRLDGIFLGSLLAQKGKKIEVDLIVSFLPRIVIDSLLTVIEKLNLNIDYLTLEPIAASNVVIPKEMYNFNLALVDIGAGTSDIAITKRGSIVAYAMVSVAGDEITEALAEYYLLDYDSGERLKCFLSSDEENKYYLKDILGQELEIDKEEALSAIEAQVSELARLIKEEIIRLNSKAPQAVMCIGGGSLTPMLTNKLADELGLNRNRVGVKDGKDIKNIVGSIEGINSTQAITPIGIALSSHQNKNSFNFIDVFINERKLQLFSLAVPTVLEALLSAELDIKNLYGRPGMGLTCTVNGDLKTIKGEMGQPCKILLNDKEAELNTPLSPGDRITFKPASNGKDAQAILAHVLPPEKEIRIIVNGEDMKLKREVYQNSKLADYCTPLIDGAEIVYKELNTIRDAVAMILEIFPEEFDNKLLHFSFNGERIEVPDGDYIIKKNGSLVDLDARLEAGISLEIERNERGKVDVASFCSENKEKEFSLIFNGSKLKLAIDRWDIRCNGGKVNLDYEIKNGDNISCHPVPVNFKRVLKEINYKFSDSLRENIKLRVNGIIADFDDPVNEGDEIRVSIK